MDRYYGGLSTPPRQRINGKQTGLKPSNQQLAGARAKDARDYEFLCMVADDVLPLLKRILPSLDPEQGGLPPTDVSEPQAIEKVVQELFKATYRHKLTLLRKKRYVVGSRLEAGEKVILHRSPTAMELRDAVRFAVKELQYIRAEIIKEDPDQGMTMRRNVAAANAIAAMRSKTIKAELKRKRLRVFKPLDPDTITAHNRTTRREVKLTAKLGRLAQRRVAPR